MFVLNVERGEKQRKRRRDTERGRNEAGRGGREGGRWRGRRPLAPAAGLGTQPSPRTASAEHSHLDTHLNPFLGSRHPRTKWHVRTVALWLGASPCQHFEMLLEALCRLHPSPTFLPSCFLSPPLSQALLPNKCLASHLPREPHLSPPLMCEGPRQGLRRSCGWIPHPSQVSSLARETGHLAAPSLLNLPNCSPSCKVSFLISALALTQV